MRPRPVSRNAEVGTLARDAGGWLKYVKISKNGGPQHRPQYAMIRIYKDFQRRAPIFWKPSCKVLALLDSCWRFWAIVLHTSGVMAQKTGTNPTIYDTGIYVARVQYASLEEEALRCVCAEASLSSEKTALGYRLG